MQIIMGLTKNYLFMKFDNCIFILVFFLMNCSSSPEITEDPVKEHSNAKPNILLIIADDVSKDAVPNYTEGIIKANMPNLQGLMSTGITFDNVWAYPVCSPTRASIITGKYGFKTGVLTVDDPISLSETSLQQSITNYTNNAYATAIIGKWHLSKNTSDPLTFGVNYFAGILNGGISNYLNWPLVENGTSSISSEYATTKLTDLAINWLGSQTKPWFLWMAYNAPHTPFHLAPTKLHSQGSLATDATSINENPLPYYLSALEAIDTEMGRLFNSLTVKERENTIIIFIGDNGSPNKVAQTPYKRTTVKGSLYQGGINVPMVVSGKGVDRLGAREPGLINSTDLFTTIGNIAGIQVKEIENSISFYDTFIDTNATRRNYVYSEKEDAYSVRDTTYKYIKFENGREELYNLSTDAYEKVNLMNNTLTTEASEAKLALIVEADRIRS